MSLETLQLGPDEWYQDNNNNKFEGGIPAEWGSLTNLKKLNAVKCGLDGKIGSTRTERFGILLTFHCFWEANCPRNSANLSI